MMLKSSTSPRKPATLEAELRTLYQRRSAVDEMIHSLEQYDRRFEQLPPRKALLEDVSASWPRRLAS